MAAIYPKTDVERIVAQAQLLTAPETNRESATMVVARCNTSDPQFISESELTCILKDFEIQTRVQIRNSLRALALQPVVASTEPNTGGTAATTPTARPAASTPATRRPQPGANVAGKGTTRPAATGAASNSTDPIPSCSRSRSSSSVTNRLQRVSTQPHSSSCFMGTTAMGQNSRP